MRAFIDMKAAINGRPVALPKLARARFEILPLVQDLAVHPAGKNGLRSRRPENHPGIGRGRPRYGPPQGVELNVGHPVLRIEQHKPVNALGRHGLKRIGERYPVH